MFSGFDQTVDGGLCRGHAPGVDAVWVLKESATPCRVTCLTGKRKIVKTGGNKSSFMWISFPLPRTNLVPACWLASRGYALKATQSGFFFFFFRSEIDPPEPSGRRDERW